MNGWGSFKVSLTKCAFCDNYFRSDSEYLGQGSGAIESAEHCGYCGAHDRDQHITRLWVQYPSVPDGQFRMRAKLTWDTNGPDSISVNVYNVADFPTTAVDGCEDTSFNDDWNEGQHVGRFTFVSDVVGTSYVLIGNENYKYQDNPAEIVIDGGSLQSTTFRFQVDNEETYLKAKFRSATLEWPT